MNADKKKQEGYAPAVILEWFVSAFISVHLRFPFGNQARAGELYKCWQPFCGT
jgi:hypothetical protein